MRKGFFILAAILTLSVMLQATAPSGAAAQEKAVNSEKTLVKLGMKGDQVRSIQQLLMNLGYPIGEVDGVYGPLTASAVWSFQQEHNLTVDGVVGQDTLKYLQRAEPIVNRSMRSMSMMASAYSAYDPGNSHYTARGSFLKKGLVAVDPSVIPLGTRLYIPGYGYAVADDVGGAIRGHRIDLAFDSHGEALRFGRQHIVVYILD